MNLRDRPDCRVAAYLAVFFGHLICLGFAFLTWGAGGVVSIRLSTSSGVGMERLVMVRVCHG